MVASRGNRARLRIQCLGGCCGSRSTRHKRLSMFWKKPKFEDPQFGTLTFSIGSWNSQLISMLNTKVIISIDGTKAAPNPQALDQAKSLAENPTTVVEAAKSFISQDEQAREFIRGRGELVFEGFSIAGVNRTFQATFGLNDWE